MPSKPRTAKPHTAKPQSPHRMSARLAAASTATRARMTSAMTTIAATSTTAIAHATRQPATKKQRVRLVHASAAELAQVARVPPCAGAVPATSRKFLGAHVSAAGGLQRAFTNAHAINANAFALFLKPRTWTYPPLDPAITSAFAEAHRVTGIPLDKVLPHGQYIVNLGTGDAVKREQAYAYFVDDLRRPGSPAGTCTTEEATANIAACINRAHSETTSVSIILECMAGQGSHIGSTFQSLRDTIALVQCKSRIGVCLDTCHMFAAGYDVRTRVGFDAVMREFDEVVGLQYLKAMHLNDSKGELGCCRDRHENIGKGHIGLEAFRFIMTDPRFNDMPLILETPIRNEDMSGWADEIRLLREFEREGSDDTTDGTSFK